MSEAGNRTAGTGSVGSAGGTGLRTPLDYSAYLFDLDGTVYLGPDLIPGAEAAITSLRAAGRRVMFLSNKPLATRASYAAKLTKLGLLTAEAEVLNSTGALAHYLQREAPGARAYVIGEAPLLEDLQAAGLRLTNEPLEAELVVVSWDRDFTYRKLDDALQALRHGARLVATNPDVACPMSGGGLAPDCGALAAAVEACSGKRVELYAGKPSPILAEVALHRLAVAAGDCLMVGDRLETDVLFGRNNGMGSALVLTGVTRRDDLAHASVQPDFVLESVAELTLEPGGSAA